ncbi:hypothetical protein EG68_08267 [Paragonimus skrjabini miyazakii]|uniref:Apple domain-containing protein n=1 Tax=Paragonimus skrjabini miyazakii TaxID=59628 RepID=A0A8S9YJ52_9TREM|nr:hypothetical protein EG68_08267 [Paragonimus skrjabini miyazakii]
MENRMRHEVFVSGRSKKTLVLSHLLIFINSVCTTVSWCPANFTEVEESMCMLPFNRSVRYCEAHAGCHAEGVKRGIRMFLLGKHTNKWMSHMDPMGQMLTGLHSLLYDVQDPRSPWMVSDPGCSDCLNEVDSLIWGVFRITERVIVCDSQQCFRSNQGGTFSQYVCEISKYPQPNKWRETRCRTNWPVKIAHPVIPDNSNEGCFKLYGKSTTILCSHKCQVSDVCRLFYYNSQTRDCYLALYVDSRLPRHLKALSGSWVRFAKPDY